MRGVLCCGLMPTLQRTLLFERFAYGEVNRAAEVIESAGGKAVNTGRALVRLGSAAQVTGLNGGESGRRVQAFLEEYGLGSAHLTACACDTRICTTLICRADGRVTELVEEAAPVSQGELQRLLDDNAAALDEAALLAICGTLPRHLPPQLYGEIAARAQAAGVPWLIDSSGEPLLAALAASPLLIKLNRAELELTLARRADGTNNLLAAMRALHARSGAAVLVTDGASALYLMLADGALFCLQPPYIDAPVNPIGSGDCVTAGIAHCLMRGESLLEAVAFGVACGSANVETLIAADLNAQRVAELYRTVKLVPLSC